MRALAAFGSEHLVAHRVINGTQNKGPTGGVGNRNAKDRNVMRIIHGPIQWINVPNMFVVALNNAGLFGKDMMTGKTLLNFAKQKRFRLVIYLGDKVYHAFVSYLMLFIVAGAQNLTCLTREVLKIRQCRLHENFLKCSTMGYNPSLNHKSKLFVQFIEGLINVRKYSLDCITIAHRLLKQSFKGRFLV